MNVTDPTDAPRDLAGDTYPRQAARTRRFTLGAPRDLTVAADGSRVAFLRSSGGDDPVNKLWVLDLPAVGAAGVGGVGVPRVVVDPVALLAAESGPTAGGVIPAAERARRERARELAGGVVAYDADPLLTRAAFALSGRVFVADLVAGSVEELPSSGDAFDPRLSPDGASVAYVSGRTLRCTGADGDRLVVGEDDPDISWGSAEFVAAEEMHRTRGFWWAPDSERLLAARVDVSPVATWHIASPVDPWVEPHAVRYPAAGTTNATVTLHVVPSVVDAGGRGDAGGDAGGDAASRVEVDWAQGEFEYLCDVQWAPSAEPTVVVQTRDQRTLAVGRVDVGAGAGAVHVVARQSDDDWVELVPGAPTWIGDRLVTAVDREDTRRVCIDGEPITPAGLQVRRLLRADASGVLVAATEDPTEVHVWRFGLDGSGVALTDQPGVHSAVAGGDVVVLTSVGPDHDGVRCSVRRDGAEIATIESFAEVPLVRSRPSFHVLGSRSLRVGTVFPSEPVDGPLPVLLDPYGGPHALRVQKARGAFATSQWFADQGFAVVVCDGRGTPARGPAWERSVRGDLARPVLEDQIDALYALAERDDRLDLSRVAIRGWSFGGYLAALAVTERPDVFHAAVAGAPVTEWGLYDTHYTERYLGHPAVEPDNYARSDLTPRAAGLGAPLLLIHGMADDNVVVAHTLRLSRALLEHGRAHQVLPLSGVTHMTPQETVAENLLRLEVDFFHAALARP